MKILVAIDDTDESWDAVDFTRRLVAGAGHEVIVLSVAEPGSMPSLLTMSDFGLGYPFPASVGADDRQLRVDDAKKLVRETGKALGASAALVDVGAPVEVIEKVADEHDVDLIVVGSHDKNWFERWLDGSVSRRLVDDGTRPVLVVT